MNKNLQFEIGYWISHVAMSIILCAGLRSIVSGILVRSIPWTDIALGFILGTILALVPLPKEKRNEDT